MANHALERGRRRNRAGKPGLLSLRSGIQKHGVCRWDGENWDWIDIPDALLEREFKGLK